MKDSTKDKIEGGAHLKIDFFKYAKGHEVAVGNVRGFRSGDHQPGQNEHGGRTIMAARRMARRAPADFPAV